ncbi:DUF3152 domain-containing protein [Streptomyces sp. NPDC058623]|uniref:DUF3152 domain-containing protein n=1 Tax=Streptomyces sp. NPDC058623 TaxID=3346563 RepID=UPI0036527517
MGRHSRKAAAPAGPAPADGPPRPEPAPYEDPWGSFPGDLYEPAPHEAYAAPAFAAGPAAPHEDARGPRRTPEPTVIHQGYVPPARSGPAVRPGGRPEQHEPGGAWGANPLTETGAQAGHGDRRGVPRTSAYASASARSAAPTAPAPPVADPFPADRFGTGSRASGPGSRPSGPFADDPFVTGRPFADDPSAAPLVPGPRESEPAAPDERTGSGRGAKFRTYTGMAAAAVTTVLAVVVAGQVALDGDSGAGTAVAGGDGGERAMSGRTDRSEGRPTPDSPPVVAAPAQPLTYEQQMALQLPIDAQLKGPGTFDTVPGVEKAPGKGTVVRYRVDVEQGLGMDQKLFAEAVQRTLNDPRSWAHGGQMTFERVPAGEVLFVITLASPGTTGVWCAKSSLDTTVDNVSCDSASTERVMINAFRWAQGSTTFGPDQMVAYRQMLINHEVGHRLGHGHVNCQTPGALAPIMQQQTKSLNINNIQCKPNPWVYPGS